MSTTNPINQTTEWDDLQIKHGNYAPLAETVTSEQESLKLQNQVASLDTYALKSLTQLNEEAEERDDKVLDAYRQRRLRELKLEQSKMRFGCVTHVSMSEYVQEVTEASKNATVICHLYKDHLTSCQVINSNFDDLARAHRDVKFCKGISDHLIPNFDDSRLPCLVIYKDGTCIKQLVGTSLFGADEPTLEKMEYILGHKMKLFQTDINEDPSGSVFKYHKFGLRNHGGLSDSEDEEEHIFSDKLNTAADDKGYSDVGVDKVLGIFRK